MNWKDKVEDYEGNNKKIIITALIKYVLATGTEVKRAFAKQKER